MILFALCLAALASIGGAEVGDRLIAGAGQFPGRLGVRHLVAVVAELLLRHALVRQGGQPDLRTVVQVAFPAPQPAAASPSARARGLL